MTLNALPNVTVVPLTSLHTAHLEPMSGTGFVVCPAPANDVWLGGSLNGADWDAAMRVLSGMGWVVLTDDDGTLIEEGATADGCPVFTVIAHDPIVSQPDVSEYVAAREALCLSSGLAY